MGTASRADVTVTAEVPRGVVWAVLSDGWSFPSWVVGASHVRDVDKEWPEAGTKIHHSFGPWPLHIDDETEVLRSEPDRLLVIQARLWPLGSAVVRLELTDDDTGHTRVHMSERVTDGLPKHLPAAVQKRLLAPRNRESLQRLARLAEGRARNGALPLPGGPSVARLAPGPPDAPRDRHADRQGQA